MKSLLILLSTFLSLALVGCKEGTIVYDIEFPRADSDAAQPPQLRDDEFKIRSSLSLPLPVLSKTPAEKSSTNVYFHPNLNTSADPCNPRHQGFQCNGFDKQQVLLLSDRCSKRTGKRASLS